MLPKRKSVRLVSKSVWKKWSWRKWLEVSLFAFSRIFPQWSKTDELVYKLAGWHLPKLLRINFFIDNFQGFWLNEHILIATSRSYKKCLKIVCKIVILYDGWNLATCTWNKQPAKEVFYKKMFWKASQNSELNTRSSHLQVFYQKGVLKNFAKFAGKHLCWSLFLLKLAARSATLLEREPSTDVSPFWEFCKMFMRILLQNTP